MSIFSHIRQTFRLALLLGLLLPSLSVLAGNETYRQGAKGSQLTAGTVLGLKDPYFGSIVGNTGPISTQVAGQFSLESQEMRVYLRLDETSDTYHGSYWKLEVTYDLEFVHPDSTSVLQTTSLSNQKLVIEYAPSGIYTDRALYRAIDAISAEVTVTSIVFKDIAGTTITKTMPEDVYLDLEYHALRYHEFDFSAPTLKTELETNTFDTATVTNQMEMKWNFLRGAESYELEYLFVETGDINPTSTAIPYDWKDATRIALPTNHYTLNLAFPPGALLYRVRGIGQFDATGTIGRKEGAWSYAPTTRTTQQAFNDNNSYNNIGLYLSTGLLPNMNWQYTAGFAEDGKRKEVIGIFDGSQRSRQQLTLINTEQHALVGETVYDHQGRATVNILPVPVNSLGLGYYTGTGTTLNGNFDRNDFDTDQRTDPNHGSYTGSLPLPANSATSTYYSGNNPMSFELRDLIPDADGYAYTQAVPTNDGTGRLRSQSGLGETFANGGDHTTRFFYSKPTQYQINRLFGAEAGYARFYQKTLTKDPNGQVSVAYTDHAGRTVATALSGNTTQNLLDLDGRPLPIVIQEDLLQEGNDPNLNGELISTYSIEVIDHLSFEYEFSYTLTGGIHFAWIA